MKLTYLPYARYGSPIETLRETAKARYSELSLATQAAQDLFLPFYEASKENKRGSNSFV